MSIEFNLDMLEDSNAQISLEDLSQWIAQDEQRTAIINLPRVQQMRIAHGLLDRMVRRMGGVKLSYEINKPYQSMGSITMEGKLLEFANPDLLAAVMRLASNTEVYPLVKNKVRMTFTFHNLTTPIE